MNTHGADIHCISILVALYLQHSRYLLAVEIYVRSYLLEIQNHFHSPKLIDIPITPNVSTVLHDLLLEL